MKKAALIFLLTAVFFVVVIGCSPQEKQLPAYENEKLGIALVFPGEWDNQYTIEESENSIQIYCKDIYESYDGMGRLFSIERQTGELITEEDMAQAAVFQKIILQGNGYTYFVRFSSDVQYPPEDTTLCDQYKSLYEGIDDVTHSISLLGDQRPKAQNEGYAVFGTSFFTLEMPDGWALKAVSDPVACWHIQDGDDTVGEITMLPYQSEQTDAGNEADDGRISGIISEEELFCKAKLSLNAAYADPNVMEKMKNSFQFSGGPFTVVDLITNAGRYISGGGEKIFGKIDSFEMENGKTTAVNVRLMELVSDAQNPDKIQMKDLNRIQTFSSGFSVRVVPLVAPDYHTYGLYEMPFLDENFIKDYENYKDFYYDFIIGADQELKSVIGHEIAE